MKHGVADLIEVLADRDQQLIAAGQKGPLKTEGDAGCAGGRGKRNPVERKLHKTSEAGEQEMLRKEIPNESSVKQEFHEGSGRLQPTAA